MARYWVGGTAAWDGTAGTKWALTSGGAGGQTVPTSADDVFFDTNSGANTVTISTGNTGAKSITCTGFTGTLTGAAAITVSGNITLVAGMTYSHTNTVFIDANSTLITAGKSFSDLFINTSGITVTLGDALTTLANITVGAGTFDTANYNVTARALISNTTSTRAITLGSSTVTLSATSSNAISLTSTGLTFNAGTSQITCTGEGANLTGGGKTFYNVSFTSTNPSGIQISQSNTFNNLSITAPTSPGVKPVDFAQNQTINGTLTASGTSALQRVLFRSDSRRTARTLTVATFAPSDCDFCDITIAGGASPVSGTRLGNCGNNTNVTFDAPKTVYWNPAAAANFFSASWATSSGSTTLSANNLPLAQDTAIIDQNSRAGLDATVTDMNVGELDMSNRTTALTVSIFYLSWNLYKNLKIGTGITTSGSNYITFSGTATQTITSNGRTLSGHITINAPSSTVELADALVLNNSFNLTAGAFDAKTYNVTATQAVITATKTRTLSMGSGTWTLTGTGVVWSSATTTGLTFNKDTANIVLSSTSTVARTFAGGSLTYNKLTIGGATGTSTLTISGSNTFSELASTKTVAHTITFTAGTTTTVGAWTITGTAGNVVTLQSSTTSSYTLTKTGVGTVSCDYMSISRSTATPGSTWYAGANSTDGGNNTGWSFTVPVLSTGNFFSMFR